MNTSRSADAGLDEVGAAVRLNETIYASEPSAHLQMRLLSVLHAADASTDVQALIQNGLKLGSVTIGPAELTTSQAEMIRRVRDQHVIAESIALLHQASETLLRIYLAHEGLPPCPWLALVRERNPQRFKKRVAERFLGFRREDHA